MPINNYQTSGVGIKSRVYCSPVHKARTMPKADAATNVLNERGKAVLAYVEHGCPRTEEGTRIFEKNFGPDFFNTMHNNLSIESILAKCGGNLDVINRVLGKYGLEEYGGLEQGSTVKKFGENVKETGFYSKYSNLYDNFLNYLYHNRSGSISDLEERFGSYASLYLDNWENIGVFRTFINSYNLINDELGENKEMLDTCWNDMRYRAFQAYHNHNRV